MHNSTRLDSARDPLIIAEDWMADGRGVALATAIETWGSAPNPVGSHLVIDGAGNFHGSVSGGCVEGAVITAAAEVIGTGAARTLEFGVADETAWRVGLSCGGRIKVHVEPLNQGRHMDAGLLKALNDERRARRAAVIVMDLDAGTARLVREEDRVEGVLGEALGKAFRTGASGAVEIDGSRLFLHAHLPQPRFVVIGAVHISQALAPMARVAGYPIEIIDPRTAFASAERFPDADLRAEWPDAVLAERPLDAYCAVAAITHDPKIDDLALKAALDAGCFYVGALGSRKTHAKRVERLLATGVSPEDITRIAAPIGLDIGAANPAEIAVSILAQVVRAFRTRGMAGERAAKGEPA